ncbi:acetyl esterase/lipase [Prosthecobacter fusiformis]|uniref:Acetyl esterase/lipase n=1 Tax=Prosthecobacter fusiformis TaxID=48464 RepID=A0A4R7RPI0_9BACT|nr:alpha/beta hydrolase [Prosthecobacter fusiformis]TDU66157.1 acetyl esterase/lipase [Prosthecobacter fusiformis]
MKLLSLLLTIQSLLFFNFAFSAPEETAAHIPRLPADLKIINNIVFKEAGGQKLDLMLFQPLEKKFDQAPLVVYIHGGGWGKGDKYKALRQDIIGVIRSLNQEGIACASIEYRLVDGQPTTANDAVADCKDAVRFLARHAGDYGIDPERIATFGSSAGGHLTLVTALGEDADYPCDPAIPGPPVRIRCVASYYPLVSFVDRELMKGSNFERPQRLLPLLGGTLEEKRDLALKLSPIELLRADSPPIFVAHGDDDIVLNFQNAIALRDAATAKGIPIECLISKGAGHGFSGESIHPPRSEIQSRTVAFFLKHLK